MRSSASASVPGVQSAALVRAVPFSGNGGTTGYEIEGRPEPDPASLPQARFHLVTPEYFKTMRIPLLKGRDFTDRDDLQDTARRRDQRDVREACVARRGSDRQALDDPNTPTPVTVIGIVGDTKHYTATEPAMPQLYAAHYQVPLIFSSLVARTSGPPMSVTNDIRKAIWSVDKDQPVWAVYRSRRRSTTRRGSRASSRCCSPSLRRSHCCSRASGFTA